MSEPVVLAAARTFTGPLATRTRSDSTNFKTLKFEFVESTVAEVFAVPPGPVHVIVYNAPDALGVTTCVPLVPRLFAVYPPESAHDVALVDDQVSVDDCPAERNDGFAYIETVGAGPVTDADTVTVALAVADPPDPVHTMVYVAVADGVTL